MSIRYFPWLCVLGHENVLSSYVSHIDKGQPVGDSSFSDCIWLIHTQEAGVDYMASQFLATKGFITRKTECFTLNKPHEAQINVSTLGAVSHTHHGKRSFPW